MSLAILIALVVGAGIGAFAQRRLFSRRPVESVLPLGEQTSIVSATPPGVASSPDGIDDTLRAAVDQLALGVVVGDTAGRSVYRNRAAAALTGTHTGVIIEDHLERALSRAREGEHVDDTVVLHGPPRLSLQLIAEPMPSGYSIATIEDVSEQARIESMRTDFVANISHELKTPVGALAVLAEALFGESDPAVIDRVAGRMVEESHRAVGSIDDLLELSRIESGPRRTEIVELADVVESAIARGRVVDPASGVVVTAVEPEQPIRLTGDGRQLVSAIGNIVENAVKYSEQGGVVQVRTRVDDSSIEVAVADEGDGIPARDLDRVFERFYRVDRARSRDTGGSGLGLSIVRHVASNHGGEVLVSSSEGEGSTFVLRLPASLIVDDVVALRADSHANTEDQF
ncbi:MAG: sensor histidine kinase [Ilumatobacter sp.]